jgi:hypothetical protein
MGTGTSGTNGGHQPVFSSAAWSDPTQPQNAAAQSLRAYRYRLLSVCIWVTVSICHAGFVQDMIANQERPQI